MKKIVYILVFLFCFISNVFATRHYEREFVGYDESGYGYVTLTVTERIIFAITVMSGSAFFCAVPEAIVQGDDENYIDMATAVSGSGPAYVFLFAELLAEAAVKIGFNRHTAEELVLQTLVGSAHLIQKSRTPPAELRRRVTSPGGTTAEAIQRFEEGKLSDLVTRAVTAAYEKAKQLGK